MHLKYFFLNIYFFNKQILLTQITNKSHEKIEESLKSNIKKIKKDIKNYKLKYQKIKNNIYTDLLSQYNSYITILKNINDKKKKEQLNKIIKEYENVLNNFKEKYNKFDHIVDFYIEQNNEYNIEYLEIQKKNLIILCELLQNMKNIFNLQMLTQINNIHFDIKSIEINLIDENNKKIIGMLSNIESFFYLIDMYNDLMNKKNNNKNLEQIIKESQDNILNILNDNISKYKLLNHKKNEFLKEISLIIKKIQNLKEKK